MWAIVGASQSLCIAIWAMNDDGLMIDDSGALVIDGQ
jgi:hypothetical protein